MNRVSSVFLGSDSSQSSFQVESGDDHPKARACDHLERVRARVGGSLLPAPRRTIVHYRNSIVLRLKEPQRDPL